VDGVVFNDWLTQLLDGESVEDVGESLVKLPKKAATSKSTPGTKATKATTKPRSTASPRKPRS
jgi:hypothetical protein